LVICQTQKTQNAHLVDAYSTFILLFYFADELSGLEWHTRYQIIKGICEGLCYLHKEKDIIHMDLKPASILLDDDMVPKIADFGISKLVCTSDERLRQL